MEEFIIKLTIQCVSQREKERKIERQIQRRKFKETAAFIKKKKSAVFENRKVSGNEEIIPVKKNN